MSCMLRVLLSMVLLAPAAVAQAQSAKPKLPALVAKHVSDMAGECRESGGKPRPSPDLLHVVDLTGDGLPDYVIHNGAFICEGAASLFSGSGGSSMAVYVGTPDRQAFAAFGSGTFGVTIEPATRPGQPPTLLVEVGGPLCGQRVTDNTPRSSYKYCQRPVLWNAATRKMDYAPVSKVRFIK